MTKKSLKEKNNYDINNYEVLIVFENSSSILTDKMMQPQIKIIGLNMIQSSTK